MNKHDEPRCCFRHCHKAATHKLGREVFFPVCLKHYLLLTQEVAP